MFPILIKLGIFELSSYGVFLALAILSGSFVVWRNIRNYGFSDDKIFDHLVITVTSAIIGARIFFALVHPEIFSLSYLRIFLIWQFPGLALWGAILGVLLALGLFTATQKVPYLYYFDAYGLGLPLVQMCISLGVFLDGTVTGQETRLPIGLPAVGAIGKHHPVALYSFVLALLFAIGLLILRARYRQRIAPGVVGWSAVSFLGLTVLSLAFLRADLLYFKGISIDQVFGTILLIGPMGPLYVKLKAGTFIKTALKFVFNKLVKKPVAKL